VVLDESEEDSSVTVIEEVPSDDEDPSDDEEDNNSSLPGIPTLKTGLPLAVLILLVLSVFGFVLYKNRP